jgi:rRNA-processing protein FCF1
MKVILDTNFILACAKQKIDFESLAEDIFDEPVEWLLPKEVLAELESISKNPKQKGADKDAAVLGFDIAQTINPSIIELGGKNPNIDLRIAAYISGKPITLATLDKGLKNRVTNPILTIRGKKSLELIRA